MHLVLASASPRRAELLAAAGFSFDVLAVDIDERRHSGEVPEHYVRRLAAAKAQAAASRLSSHERLIVLGADTAVVVDGDVLGKPGCDEEARLMLSRLSGRRHQVLTGVSLRPTWADGEELGCVERTDVFFDKLGDADIDWYVQTGEGRDKAGAYAIQGLCSRFIPRIEGSYSNVVGLPVAAVQALLTKTLALLPRGAYVINTARGPCVDANGLLAALDSGQVAYAALDVVEREPLDDERVRKHPRIVLTPHTAFYSIEGYQEMRSKGAEEARRILLGEKVRNPVNLHVLKNAHCRV